MYLLDPSGRRRLLSRLAALPILGLVACSFIYDLSGVQCEETADCQALGAGTVCENSVCVTPEPSDGLGGGDGGECDTNSDCIDAPGNNDEPAICRAGSCIQLKLLDPTAECPWVLGDGENNANLRKPEPIIIGAYAPIGFQPEQDPVMLNYEFAIEEMNSASGGGIPGGPGGSSRPFVAVVCKAVDAGTGEPNLELSMDHLIQTLEVPAIISALFAPELKETFDTQGRPNDVFFMSPLDADTTLTLPDDDGLLWHMLPEGRDLAPGYLALVPEIEEWLHTEREIPADEPIKLALVDAANQFLVDISNDVMDALTYNGGKDVGENEDDLNFLYLQTDSTVDVPEPDIEAARDALLAFAPDVILSIGSLEALDLIASLESAWMPSLGPKPFYVVSPYVYGALAVPPPVVDEYRERMLGVNFAGAEDPELYEDYLRRIEAVYDVPGLAGKENFYDAAYFVMYAIAGAGNPSTLRGSHVAAGMERLINPRSAVPQIEVGIADVPYALQFLSVPNSKIELIGTLGPPDFNAGTGARNGVPSIYCVDPMMNRIQDALLYAPETGTVSGDQQCVPNFPPQ